MVYYAEKPWSHAETNKLYEAVNDMLREYDRFVFTPDRLEVVKDSIVRVINRLSTEFPRCKPLEPKWNEQDERGAINTPNKKFKSKHRDWVLFIGPNQYYAYLHLKICREEKDLKR